MCFLAFFQLLKAALVPWLTPTTSVFKTNSITSLPSDLLPPSQKEPMEPTKIFQHNPSTSRSIIEPVPFAKWGNVYKFKVRTGSSLGKGGESFYLSQTVSPNAFTLCFSGKWAQTAMTPLFQTVLPLTFLAWVNELNPTGQIWPVAYFGS